MKKVCQDWTSSTFREYEHIHASLAFCSAWSSVGARFNGEAAGFVPAVADDLAVAHDHDAFAVGGDVEFVGDHDDGDARVVEFLEQPHDLDAGAGVEIAGGLVGQDEFRLVDQGAGDGDALLLSAGKLAGMMVTPVAQADLLQRLEGALSAFTVRNDGQVVKHRQLDILQGAGARQEIEALKHEAKFLVAEHGQLFAVKPGHANAIEHIVSAGGLVEASEHVHEGGFARAARAHDRHKIPALDFQVDAAHGFHLDFARPIRLGEIVELDDGCAVGFRAHGAGGGGPPKDRGFALDERVEVTMGGAFGGSFENLRVHAVGDAGL